MGLSFRKSIKIGKGVNLNISKRGVGLSAGVKGARVSVNKNGIGGSVGIHGVRYSKYKSFKSMGKNNTHVDQNNKARLINNNTTLQFTGNNIKENLSNSYTRHIKLIFPGFICLFIGFAFPPLLFIAIILLFSGIICMIKNWKRINEEYKIRKSR